MTCEDEVKHLLVLLWNRDAESPDARSVADMPTRQPLDGSGSLKDQVARNLRNAIEAGVLRDGEVLPSTRDLATEWEVSVFTINEAMQLLADEGLITAKSRSMRVVTTPEQPFRAKVRPTRPSVVMVGGYAGSGKTELGRILARESGWPILDKDTATRAVVEHALEVDGVPAHDRESEVYLQKVRPLEYASLLALTTENAECGVSAVVTAPFVREFRDEAWRKRTEAAFTAIDAVVTFAWVRCDPETMLTYLRHRGAARDAAKLAEWDDYLASIEPMWKPDFPHVLIDNSASSEPLQSQARGLLNTALQSVAT